MAEVFGYELVARALKNEGADTSFSLWAVQCLARRMRAGS